MLECVSDEADITNVRREIAALKSLRENLTINASGNRAAAGISVSRLESVSQAGDPDSLESQAGALWLALCLGIQDREAMVDAVGTKTEKHDALREARSIKRLRCRLFPGRKTFMEQFQERATCVSWSELRTLESGK